ncbi:YeeE/YedE family protein [Cohnella yongneupensis]|uniref:YeeE/YedE family protein n=1 Tax=Cohnella yongneupensis TaxID=425006 RepID=A0ABW0R0Y6_9BACL
MSLFHDQPEWYYLGPLFGITVAAMYAVSNKPLGATGFYAQLTDKLLGRPMKEAWRLWYLLGVMLGGMSGAWISGNVGPASYYGKLGDLLTLPALIPILFIGGVLMGIGARSAGGCTSGHGLCGTSTLSPGSIVSTIVFFGVAVIVTWILNLVTGGTL